MQSETNNNNNDYYASQSQDSHQTAKWVLKKKTAEGAHLLRIHLLLIKIEGPGAGIPSIIIYLLKG